MSNLTLNASKVKTIFINPIDTKYKKNYEIHVIKYLL